MTVLIRIDLTKNVFILIISLLLTVCCSLFGNQFHIKKEPRTCAQSCYGCINQFEDGIYHNSQDNKNEWKAVGATLSKHTQETAAVDSPTAQFDVYAFHATMYLRLHYHVVDGLTINNRPSCLESDSCLKILPIWFRKSFLIAYF